MYASKVMLVCPVRSELPATLSNSPTAKGPHVCKKCGQNDLEGGLNG